MAQDKETPGLAYWFGFALGSTLGFLFAFGDASAVFAGVCCSISAGVLSAMIFYSIYRRTVSAGAVREGVSSHGMGCGLGTSLILAFEIWAMQMDLMDAFRAAIPLVLVATCFILPVLLGRTTGYYGSSAAP